MKKKLKYFLCLVTICFGASWAKVYAQNLVPNYSFEDTLQCPFNPAQVSFSPPWYDPNGGSSDYYNVCGTNGYGVPNNESGQQFARTGAAYMGLYTYYSGFDGREYIQVKLIDQLKINKTYCAEFYVNLADTFSIASNNIGMHFSATAITGLIGQVLNVIPQINNDINTNFLIDKIGWTKISGTFTASGTENYITIGNFLNDPNTDTIHIIGGSYQFSYYFIDDVSVKCCDCDTSQPASLSVPNIFTPNNDGINDVFKITSKNITTLNCKIYNRWGILVKELTKINEAWDGLTTSGLQCNAGVYYYVLTAIGDDGKEYDEKGFIYLSP